MLPKIWFCNKKIFDKNFFHPVSEEIILHNKKCSTKIFFIKNGFQGNDFATIKKFPPKIVFIQTVSEEIILQQKKFSTKTNF